MITSSRLYPGLSLNTTLKCYQLKILTIEIYWAAWCIKAPAMLRVWGRANHKGLLYTALPYISTGGCSQIEILLSN